MDNDIQKLVNDKILVIDTAEKTLLDSIKTKQETLTTKLIQLYSKLTVSNGNINQNDTLNKRLLNLLNKDLIGLINKSTYKSDVSKYLKVFDDVTTMSKIIIEKENNLDLKDFNLSIEKQLAIDEITGSLLNDDVLKQNLVLPLKKVMYRHVTTGITYADAVNEMTLAVGKQSKYFYGIVSESMSRYDGTINQRVATEFKLDAFRIVGSLIKSSAVSCINMINETGPFTGMAVNGKYAMSDLPKIIKILQGYKGFVAGTNEKNYFINRNHHNCRHVFIPTRFLRRDKEAMNKEVFGNVMKVDVGKDKPKFFPEGFDVYEKDKNLNIDYRIFDLLNDKVEFTNKNDGAYFVPSTMTVNIPKNRIDPEMVIYHEFGHAIDEQKGLYKSKGIRDLMAKYRTIYDYKKIKEIDTKLDNLHFLSDKKKSKSFKEIVAVRDTIKSLNINFGAGHSTSYFKKPWMKEKEFIAHMFENKFVGNRYFKRYMPDLYKEMIEYVIE